MDERIKQLESEINLIKSRNTRVEGDKAWETSWFRAIVVTVITYIIASLVMHIIKIENVFLNALIPTVGYFLSTLSIPIIKKWWIKKQKSSPTNPKI
jgi:hypothetical protein